MALAWQEALQEAERRDGALGLDPAVADGRLRACLEARLAGLHLPSSPELLDELAGRSAMADLMLATAADAGHEGARAAIRSRVAEALAALARRRGIVAGLAPRRVSEVIEAALAPTTEPPPRTPLGAYDGTSSLVGWLAVGLEEGVRRAAREVGPGETPPPPEPPFDPRAHPDANLLAGLAEGRLLPVEADLVSRHVAACARCAELLRGLDMAGLRAPRDVPGVPAPGHEGAWAPDPRARRAPRPSPPSPTKKGTTAHFLAVGVIAGVIGLAVALGAGPLLTGSRGSDSERFVASAMHRIAQSEPDLFAEFQPYSREELERAPAPHEGRVEVEGAEPLIAPRDRVLSDRPTFHWPPVPRATGYVLVVRDEEGRDLVRGTTREPGFSWPEDAPALERGMPITWEVRAEGVDAPPAQARFSAVLDRDVLHWQRRVDRLAVLLEDEPARDVVRAQLALRRGLPDEAWAAIRRHGERFPKDRYGRLVEQHLRRTHGYR